LRVTASSSEFSDALDDRHRDIARSVQSMYEEAFFHLIGRLSERYGLEQPTFADGCAMNSVANGRVRRMTPFRRVYVQSAAGDGGGSTGAAFALGAVSAAFARSSWTALIGDHSKARTTFGR